MSVIIIGLFLTDMEMHC